MPLTQKRLSDWYFKQGNLSTKNVDNSVEAVDMFHKCNENTGVLSDCTVNRHGM